MIGTAGSPEKAQLARDAGADECIIYTEADFESETKRLTDAQGVHVVYDGVGKAHPYLRAGHRVRVVHGPMAGTEGILLRKKDKLRIVMSLDLLMRSIAVEVDAADVVAA